MKLVFKKDEKSQISVFQSVDGKEIDFSYVEMIKTLINSKELAEPQILDGFSDPEKDSINSMVSHINKELSEIGDADS